MPANAIVEPSRAGPRRPDPKRAVPRRWERAGATVAAVALALAIPALPFGRAVTLTLVVLALLVLFALPGRVRYLGDLGGCLRRPFAWAILLTALLWLPGVIGSVAPAKSLLVWGRSFFYAGAAVMIWSFFSRDIRARELCLRLLLLVSAAVLAFMLYCLFVQPQPIVFLRGHGWQVMNVSYLIKYFASAAMCLIPVCLWAGFRFNGGWRFLGIGIAGAAAALILGLNSGAALLGLAFSAAAVSGLVILRRRKIALLFVLLAGLVLTGYFGARFMQETRSYEGYDLERLDLFAPLWLLDPHRQVIWRFTLDKALQSPWTGHGIDAINKVEGAHDPIPGLGLEHVPSHPHNWFLEILAETGIIGVLPFGVALSLFAGGLVRDYWRGGGMVPLAALALFLAFWGSALMNFSIWASWWQATFLILTAILLSDCAGAGAERRRGAAEGAEAEG
jgi:O-antigen ligase